MSRRRTHPAPPPAAGTPRRPAAPHLRSAARSIPLRLVPLLLVPLLLSALAACGPGNGDGGGASAAGEGTAEATARLRSLPYGRWVPVAEGEVAEGVVHHDPSRAWPGRNLFSPRHLARAFLLDMEGQMVAEWYLRDGARDGFHHIEPTADGGLVALIKNHRILRLDADSEVVWSRALPVHHDIAFTPDGGLWVPTRHRRWVEVDGHGLPILDDRLTRLDPEGRVLRELSLWEIFGPAVGRERWESIRRWRSELEDPSRRGTTRAIGPDTPADVFHTNSVEVLPRTVPGLGKAGDLLISVREIDTVAVVDPATGEVRWSWGPGELERQHHPSLTPRNTVLIFDNGRSRKWSRAVEVDPATGAVVWEYRADPPESFFSASRGGVQRLPNGNTLVTESDAGRVFEVTPGGEIVWEMLAPLRRNAQGEVRRSAVYRLRRLPADWPGEAEATDEAGGTPGTEAPKADGP